MISVIVPVYNAEKYLDKCLSSIINQTYFELEIILINDGSTDSSRLICEKYKQMDGRIILVNKNNEGLVRARKDGVRIARGEYITFVDADDWLDITTYDKVYEETADIIAYGLVEEYGYCCKKKNNNISAGFYDSQEIENNVIPQMLSSSNFYEFGILPNMVCKLIKKELLLNTIDEVSDNVTIGEDVDFFFRTIFKAKTLMIKDDILYHYRQQPESMMRQKITFAQIRDLYWDLYRIKEAVNLLEWKSQLNRYITFVMLLKCPEKIIERIAEFDDITGNVVIYGAGGFGKSLYMCFKNNKDIRQILIVDKEWENLQNELYEVSSIDDIIKFNPDKIVIAIINDCVCDTVEKHLCDIGINSKIIIKVDYGRINVANLFAE